LLNLKGEYNKKGGISPPSKGYDAWFTNLNRYNSPMYLLAIRAVWKLSHHLQLINM